MGSWLEEAGLPGNAVQPPAVCLGAAGTFRRGGVSCASPVPGWGVGVWRKEGSAMELCREAPSFSQGPSSAFY